MPQLETNGIRVEYDTFGREADRPLLLVMGLGAQMIAWDDDFCERLAAGGHQVIRFDNRDIGLSTKFDDAPIPDMGALTVALQEGRRPDVPYSLDDMADDAVGVLDGLGIDRAHVCGASMGGMIVQAMAIRHPQRIRSLTSIMATTGNPDVPPATPEAMAALTSEVPADLEGYTERTLAIARIIGSTGFELDEAWARDRARRTFERSVYPQGSARQMAAVVAHGNRGPALEALETPALVIHGSADPLVHPEGGRDTHRALRNSELLMVEGMGHDLPVGAWDDIIRAITLHTANHH